GRKSSEPAAVCRGLAAWGDRPRFHSGAVLFPPSFPTGAPPGVFFCMVGPGVSLTVGFLSLASLQPQTPRRPTHTSMAGTVRSNRRMLTDESPQTTSRQIDDVSVLVAGDVEPGGEIDPREDRPNRAVAHREVDDAGVLAAEGPPLAGGRVGGRAGI